MKRENYNNVVCEAHQSFEDSSIWMRRVVSFVEQHLGETISLNDIADAAGMSRYALCRIFRMRYSVSPMKWLGQMRVETSKSIMMRNPQISLADVAIYCGFSSPSHLSRAFKLTYGVAPSEMRKSDFPQVDLQTFALAG